MRHKDLEIDIEEPFDNCQLGREKYANVLSSIVDNDKDGFVLAIDGKWGTGKTTFVKMWRQKLENDGHKTLYFNAWENDFVSEPMVGILGEMKTLTTKPAVKTFDKILTRAANFSTKIIPALTKTAATLAGLGGVADAIEKVTEATTEAFSDEIKEYEDKKESLKSLKADLALFVKETCGDKPLVFIVDELDRCRPDYAVEVLEKIKHFFSVEGIVFVLSIDKEQLSNSIKGFYGSESIDAKEYLRRFIDIEYQLPEPSYEDFSKYLYGYYKFSEFFEQHGRKNHRELRFDSESFYKVVNTYCQHNKLSLRQMEKIFAHTRIITKTFNADNYAHPEIIFFLIVLKEYHTDIYQSLRDMNDDIQTIATKLDETIKGYIASEESYHFTHHFEYILAMLIKFYRKAKYSNGVNYEILKRVEGLNGDAYELTFTLRYADPSIVLRVLLDANANRRDSVLFTYYTDKIDLLDPLVS